jgi:predicted nucleic acid-binding protein
VTRFLLDTNVISETTRPKPASQVTRWIRQLETIALPAITVYEVAVGIGRVPSGKKRAFLEDWFAELLADCEVLPFDRDAALSCAHLEAQARHRRRTIPERDLMILAIARSRNLAVATRNVPHFHGFGVPVYDPFGDVRA